MKTKNIKQKFNLCIALVVLNLTVIQQIALAGPVGPPPPTPAPVNDSFQNATLIEFDDSGTFSDYVPGIFGATAEESDPVDCYKGDSVWYRYEASRDAKILIATSDSDGYDARISVYKYITESDSLELDSCQRQNFTLDVIEGQIYYFKIVSDSKRTVVDANSNLNFFAGFSLEGSTVTLDDSALIDKSGNAIISGILDCPRRGILGVTRFHIDVRQSAFSLYGSILDDSGGRGSYIAFCGPWSFLVPQVSSNRPFIPGTAEVNVNMHLEDRALYEAVSKSDTKTVLLKRSVHVR